MSDDSSQQGHRNLTRRDFAVGGVNLSFLALLGAIGCKSRGTESGLQQGAVTATPSSVRVRKNVWTLSPDSEDIVAYRAAIAEMAILDRSNPLSWEGQAYVHVNSCPHGNWFFLPWHRAYLLHFENIIQYWAKIAAAKPSASPRLKTVMANPNYHFALPYWDWTNSLAMPGVVANDRNFNHATWSFSKKYNGRSAAPGFREDFMGRTAIASVLATRDFYAFASGQSVGQRDAVSHGTLEGTPHNNVHVAVGGEMQRMTSPLDPIFWMHHCNVDRLWAHWAQQRGARSVPPTRTAATQWRNFTLTGFFDLNKRPATMTVANTLTLGNAQMPFTYDSLPATPARRTTALGLTETAEPAATEAGINEDGSYEAPVRDAKEVVPEARKIERMTYMGRELNRLRIPLGMRSNFPMLEAFFNRSESASNDGYFLKITNLPVPPPRGDGTESGIKRVWFYFTEAAGNVISRRLLVYGFFAVEDHSVYGGDHAAHATPQLQTLFYDVTDSLMEIRDSKTFQVGKFLYLSLALMDGTNDGNVNVNDEDVTNYLNALKNAGLKVEFSA